jgi:tetratricopeptide (TPR) repeat protein
LTADLYLSLKHYSKALAFYLKIAETGKPSVYVDRGILGILVSMNDIAEPIEKAKLLSGIRKGAANHAKDTEKVKAKLLAAIDIYVEEASKKVSSSPESHRLASEVLTLVEQNEAIASMEKNSYAMIGVLYSGALWNEVVYWANVFSVKYQAGKSLNTLHRFKGVAHDRLLDYKQALTSYLEFLRKSRPNDDGFEKTYLRALELASLTQSTGALNELASLSINRISRESLTLTRFNLVMEKLHAVERWSDAQNFAKDFRMTQEELGAVVFADFWMAKILVSRGEEDEGIEKLKIIAQKIESNGLQDQGIELRDALAEAYLLVAKFSIEDFRAFTVPEDEGNKSEYISEKINLFSALSTQLEKCFELGSEKGSFEAQFIRAEMARELSELITSLLTRKESFADSKKDRLRSVAEGLMELSRSSHSKNALYVSRQNKFAKQNGSKVEENTWIRRSAVALGKTEKVDGKEELPVSVVAPMFLPF